MVKLFSYLRHYEFERGLRMLEKGYIAARSALQAEVERIEAEAAAYEYSLANGGEWIGEYEDGHLLWNQSQAYKAEIDTIELAQLEIRKVYVIALYHHWERSAASWKGKYATHDELAKYCMEQGYGLSPDLNGVQYLANHLKHGPNSRTNWLSRLKKEYPLLFPSTQNFIFGLSEGDLDKVAAVILESGPKAPRIEATRQ